MYVFLQYTYFFFDAFACSHFFSKIYALKNCSYLLTKMYVYLRIFGSVRCICGYVFFLYFVPMYIVHRQFLDYWDI